MNGPAMPSIPSLILGLVQGLTEFLPVSSSGHLVLVSHLLHYDSPGLVLETVVHLATTLVVLIYFRRRLWEILSGIQKDWPARRLLLMLALAFGVTALVGLLISPWIPAAFDSPGLSGAMLLVTSAILLSIRFLRPEVAGNSLWQVSWKVALIVGLAQGIAILPGISRSGITIVVALWAGQSRTSAAEYSFLLAIPTLLAASAFSFLQDPQISGADARDIAAAAAVAFASGFLAVHWLMRWLERGRLWWFSGYCAVAGAGSLVLWAWPGA